MYYQQYSTYRQQWYGPQPQHQQYLSCMHQQQHQTQPTQHHHQQPPPPQPTPSWHHTEGLLDAGVVQAVGPTGQVGHWEPPQLVAALSPPATLSPPQELSPRPPPARSPYEWMKKPSYQTQPNPGKTRTKDKYRVVYTDHQRLELEKEFHYSRYITIRRKAELAASLALSERQVKIWFQNRRAKERKQVKKREELIHKEKMQQLAML